MNHSTDYYFSDWEVVTLPIICGHFLFILLPSLLLNTSILLVLVTQKSLHSPLCVLYGFVLVLATYNSIVTGTLGYTSLVIMIRNCDCSLDPVYQGSSTTVHNTLYPIAFAQISLLHLFVIKCRKNCVSYKMVLILLVVTTVLYTPVTVFLFASSYTKFCDRLCLGLDASNASTLTSISIAYFAIQALGWVGSMVVIITCYTWVWVLYKKGILRGNRIEGHGISLKIATLPAVMPIVMHIQVLPFFLQSLIGSGAIKKFPLHWQQVMYKFPFLLSDLSGLVYPILLLYLSNKIRSCWKKMFHGHHGIVMPEDTGGYAENSLPTEFTTQVGASPPTEIAPSQFETPKAADKPQPVESSM